MEFTILCIFTVMIVCCIIADYSIIYALAAGLVMFMVYGHSKGFSWTQLLHMAFKGIKTARNVLILFIMIGMLTAVWRASGTIAAIISYASFFIKPSIILLMTFWLNAAISALIGTAFGTAATMGVICATMATALGIPPMLVGGAVLSGVFFGDRWSPLSTSCMLVTEITQTNIYDNLRRMFRTCLVPFVITSLAYGIIGYFITIQGELIDLNAIFAQEFIIHPLALLPAVVVILLASNKVNVKKAMSISSIIAIALCLFLQNQSLPEIISTIIYGYKAKTSAAAPLVNGGGVVSMLRVALIILISSSYSDIFQQTGLLNSIKLYIAKLGQSITKFGAVLVISVLTSAIACNQTLAVMLTHQICKDNIPTKEQMALYLEDTVIVIAPLIPWSIAGAVPLASANAPMTSYFFAFYLFLLPLYRWAQEWYRK